MEPPAAGGRYAGGQCTITAITQVLPTGGEPAAAQGRPPSPAPSSEPAARRRPARSASFLRVRCEAELTGWLPSFRHEYYAKKVVQQRYARPGGPPPPPDLPRRGPVEITPALWHWVVTHCEEPRVVIPLYGDKDRPVCIVAERSAAHGAGSKRQKQSQVLVRWEPYAVDARHLPMFAQMGYTAERTEPCEPSEHGEPMVLAHWQDTWEPTDTVLSFQGGAALLDARRAEQAAAAEQAAQESSRRRSRDAQPVQKRLEEQGVLAEPLAPVWNFADADAASRIELHTEPARPDLDVLPPEGGASGHFVRMDREPAQGSGSLQLAHVHDPAGRWVGTVTGERLAHLSERFRCAQAARPELFTRLGARSFEDELAALIQRWRAKTLKHAERPDRLHRLHGSAPAGLVAALSAATGADTQLFSSPLTVHPSMLAYFSADARDQLFGAEWDPYSRRWVGACFAPA